LKLKILLNLFGGRIISLYKGSNRIGFEEITSRSINFLSGEGSYVFQR
jgi:hypothetical protein